MKSTNMLERFNQEIKRRTHVVRIFPNAASCLRLVRALATEEVIQSQDAGFRHRHDGLAYRLSLKDRSGTWRPPKRIVARRSHLSPRYRLLFRLREILRDESHLAFVAALERRDISIFFRRMKRLLAIYDFVQRFGSWKRRLGRLTRQLGLRKQTPP
jgi:coenzyme F420 hydrogenase subunit beta